MDVPRNGKRLGLAHSTVQGIWKAHGLSLHRRRVFKLSKDPAFAEKLVDVVGFYIDPPAHVVVLRVYEKPQIQALDRTQPGLPMKKGRAGTMTHDYKRKGNTTLFAALNTLTGKVFKRNMARHRRQESLRFLNALEREIPAGKVVHAILDNSASHKTPEVRRWLARHPRWTLHFTPTSSSWPNAVEHAPRASLRDVFAKLTRRRLKHGVFQSVVDLRPRSTASSPSTTLPGPNPSSGVRTPTASSRSETEGSKRCNQSTRREDQRPAE